MAWTGLGPELFLPELEERPWGRFIDVVPNIKDRLFVQGSDRTILGARWMAEAAMSMQLLDVNCDLDVSPTKTTGTLSLSEETTAAFLSFNLWECSTLSGDMDVLADYVSRSAESLVSEALTWVATHALSANHLNLAEDSDTLSASSTAVEAIGRVESGLAERISNKRGYIFVPLRHLAEAMAENAVLLVNGELLSPAGHRVIVDAGLNNAANFYGTGSIGWSVTDIEFLSGDEGQIDITRNTRTWLSENYGLVAFNPAHSVKTTYSYAESL